MCINSVSSPSKVSTIWKPVTDLKCSQDLLYQTTSPFDVLHFYSESFDYKALFTRHSVKGNFRVDAQIF